MLLFLLAVSSCLVPASAGQHQPQILPLQPAFPSCLPRLEIGLACANSTLCHEEHWSPPVHLCICKTQSGVTVSTDHPITQPQQCHRGLLLYTVSACSSGPRLPRLPRLRVAQRLVPRVLSLACFLRHPRRLVRCPVRQLSGSARSSKHPCPAPACLGPLSPPGGSAAPLCGAPGSGRRQSPLHSPTVTTEPADPMLEEIEAELQRCQAVLAGSGASSEGRRRLSPPALRAAHVVQPASVHLCRCCPQACGN